MLKREFERDPERQARRERMFGPSTLDMLRAEQSARRGDSVNYRVRRLKRVYRADAIDAYNDELFGEGHTAKLRRQAAEHLAAQKRWMRDYGDLDGFAEYYARRTK
jgi:hypothetical protein